MPRRERHHRPARPKQPQKKPGQTKPNTIQPKPNQTTTAANRRTSVSPKADPPMFHTRPQGSLLQIMAEPASSFDFSESVCCFAWNLKNKATATGRPTPLSTCSRVLRLPASPMQASTSGPADRPPFPKPRFFIPLAGSGPKPL